MQQCPVCDQVVENDLTNFESHVSAHFEDQEAAVPGSSSLDEAPCFVCGSSLPALDESAKQLHVNACLDGHDARADDEQDTDMSGASQAKDVNYWQGAAANKDDRWWDAASSSMTDLPNNFSPGVIKVLAAILEQTHSRSVTRSAVLCHAQVVHMQGAWMFDKSWGCGYRNTLMSLSALLGAYPHYRDVFSAEINGSPPGVRRVQGWIEEAWYQGFDAMGRQQLKGKLLGTRKWIGASDASFVGCVVVRYLTKDDFPKPTAQNHKTGRATHQVLQDWVIAYFDGDKAIQAPSTSQDNKAGNYKASAFDVLMASKGGSAVRTSSNMPLILQHSGHSRTIIGYEVNNRGDTNLLLFDPAKPMPKDIRKSSLEGLSPPTLNGKASFSRLDPSGVEPEMANHGKRSRSPSGGSSSSKKSRPALEPDEEANAEGWVKKKGSKIKALAGSADWQKEPVKALKMFRVNLSALSSHTEYQILAFSGGRLLTESERLSRKELVSHKMT